MRITVKIGSNVLTRKDGSLDLTRMSALVDQIATLYKQGVQIVLVSSGAVAFGRSLLKGQVDISQIDEVQQRQLFSAVGQTKLIDKYYEFFREWGIMCGQVLTTKVGLSTPDQRENQQRCMETMLEQGVIPIVNENDTISITEQVDDFIKAYSKLVSFYATPNPTYVAINQNKFRYFGFYKAMFDFLVKAEPKV
ncbi:MAG: hypothetical protein J6P82_01185, partial [Bacteroidales bacterium]|nr:hypothetical protein [Bacteroidales bacterium]